MRTDGSARSGMPAAVAAMFLDTGKGTVARPETRLCLIVREVAVIFCDTDSLVAHGRIERGEKGIAGFGESAGIEFVGCAASRFGRVAGEPFGVGPELRECGVLVLIAYIDVEVFVRNVRHMIGMDLIEGSAVRADGAVLDEIIVFGIVGRRAVRADGSAEQLAERFAEIVHLSLHRSLVCDPHLVLMRMAASGRGVEAVRDGDAAA